VRSLLGGNTQDLHKEGREVINVSAEEICTQNKGTEIVLKKEVKNYKPERGGRGKSIKGKEEGGEWGWPRASSHCMIKD